jgi:hypothetical protein
MPKYIVYISPNSILNEEEYVIEAESEDMAKDFAIEKYFRDRASSMEFDFEVEEI